MKTTTLRKLMLAAVSSLLALTQVAKADTADIADKPMTGAAKVIKPNVMFLLDASGSMASEYMPDVVPGTSKYGYYAAQCNGVAYNPNISYLPPQHSDGTSAPNVSFTQAWDDGYVLENLTQINSTTSMTIGTGTGKVFTISTTAGFSASGTVMIVSSSNRNIWMLGTVTSWNNTTKKLTVSVTSKSGSGTFASWTIVNPVDLSASTQKYYTYSGTYAALSYSYDSSGNVIKTGSSDGANFYKECNSSIGNTPGKNVFTQVTVTSGSSDAQNYANWYSYYRNRMNTMKTSMSLAFGGLIDPQNFRVGFSTIAYSGTDSGDDHFLKIGDYCTAATNCQQRQDFFKKIYRSSSTSWTPLRNALSKAGLIYAGKLLTGADDPVQYYCQKNWAILSTDGYWNTGGGTGNGTNYDDWNDKGGFSIGEAATYPTAGSGVGKQDGKNDTDYTDINGNPVSMKPPMLDGNDYSNTLADVAMYYYKTDLRDSALSNCTSGSTGNDTCENKVPLMPDDCNPRQHMNAITFGLGVNGYYSAADYPAAADPNSDYSKLKAGTVNWPDPSGSDALTIDDLWHAAINARGVYYHPNDPTSIVNNLSQALAKVASSVGGGAGAGFSTLQLSASSPNYVYSSDFTDSIWDGDVQAFTISAAGVLSGTGSSAGTCNSGSGGGASVWSARDRLQAKGANARTIYTAKGGWGNFNSSNPNLTTTDFNPNNLSQHVSYSAAEAAEVTTAGRVDLINYLRGVEHAAAVKVPSKFCCENESDNDYKLFRNRDYMLGDIVHSSPYYVGVSPFQYTDANHGTFVTDTIPRAGTLYVGANDGMLHAFDSTTGDERWAFVPSAVVPNLYKLADFTYNSNHLFFVDGQVNAGDVCPSAPTSACTDSQWKTLLVGGLGEGGRDIFALDVTDPNAPSLRWEFAAKNPTAAANLGRSFGTPLIAKIKGGGATMNGKWVVIFSSGYNNVSPGDGKTHLFVVDAWTGNLIWDISGFAGGETSPDKSGMGSVSGWTDHGITDNSVQHVYGGDLNGNVWRFDISTGAASDVVKIAELTDPSGVRQPITTKPELGEATTGTVKSRVVFVGTGKWLGFYADVPASPAPAAPAAPVSPVRSADQVQSIYAIKDSLGSTSATSAFRNLAPAKVVITGSGTVRSITFAAANAVGWYADFPALRERVTVDPELQIGWLSVTTSVPDVSDACATGGDSFHYFLPYNPQGTETFQNWMAVYLGNALAAGSGTVQTPNGSTGVVVTDATGKMQFVPNQAPPSGTVVRRVSWRELVN